MLFFRPLFCFIFILLAANITSAEEPTSDILHVLRPVLNSNLEKPELCLEFDHALDPSYRDQNALTLHLDSSEKTITLTRRNLSISSSLLCLPPLEYHHEYHLVLSDILGLAHEKLSENYTLSFSIGDRRPALTLTSDRGGDGLARWRDSSPQLHSVNVPHVHLDLYRIVGSDAMIEAWLKHPQSTLAPSESTYFARTHGDMVWQSEFSFEGDSNKSLVKTISLNSLPETLPPGLYLMAASAPNVTIKPSDAGLAPQAALWLLRSDLDLRVAKSASGLYVFSQNFSTPTVVAHSRITLLDSSHHILTEKNTGDDGVAYFPLDTKGFDSVNSIMGQSSSGEVAFSKASEDTLNIPVLATTTAALNTLQSSYIPGEKVKLFLALHDSHNTKPLLKGSSLQIMRIDQSAYANLTLPDIRGEIVFAFDSPLVNGEWPLRWIDSDGHTLATTTLRTSTNPDAPRFNITSDHPWLTPSGDLVLTISSLTDKGLPAPYLSGNLSVKWVNADNLFPNWGGYHFGRESNEETPPTFLSHLITDTRGLVKIPLVLTPPADFSSAAEAILLLHADAASGTEDASPLVLPVKPRDFAIGVNPFVADGHFPENSVARFSVVAINGEGHKVDASNLSFQIFDDGRNFEWYQSEGNWSYRPLQHLRRLGGKTLSLDASEENYIEWPVTAGTYRLDISDGDGNILNRIKFNAGWKYSTSDNTPLHELPLRFMGTKWQKGQKIAVGFELEKPSRVITSVADDQVRQVFMQAFPAGPQEITINANANWGEPLLVRVDADDVPAAGQIILSPSNDNVSSAKLTSRAHGDSVTNTSLWHGTIPTTLSVGDSAIISLGFDAIKNHAPLGAYHYSLLSGPLLKTDPGVGSLEMSGRSEPELNINLTALQAGSDNLKIEITDPNNKKSSQSYPILVNKNYTVSTKGADQEIKSGQTNTFWTADKDRSHIGYTIYLIDGIPMFNTASLLHRFLTWRVFLTTDFARTLLVLKNWRTTILASGLMTEPQLKARNAEVIVHLLQRQNSDGGFSNRPAQESEMETTALAVVALTAMDEANAVLAKQRGQGWLKHHLDNTWFDEKERPQRSLVYTALALSGDVDHASLNFFSDTSADKKLPPQACVELAEAFAVINDKDKSLYWLNNANISLTSPTLDPALLPALAMNSFVEPKTLLPALEALAKKTALDSVTFNDAYLFLLTRSSLEFRDEEWHAQINGTDKTAKEITVYTHDNKSFSVRNLGERSLWVSEVLKVPEAMVTKIEPKEIQRRFYRVDGTLLETGSPLDQGETYLVTLEGPWSKQGSSQFLFVNDNPYPALTPLSCALTSETKTGEQIRWLKDLHLTDTVSCDMAGYELAMMIASDKEAAGLNWRVGYFAKAEWGGQFRLSGALSSREGQNWVGEKISSRQKVNSK